MKKVMRYIINNSETIVCASLSGYLGWALGLKMGLAVIFAMALHAMWTK